MKSLKAVIALLLCITMAYASQAQTGQSAKPKLFSNYPQNIECSEAELAKIFATSANQSLVVDFQNSLSFSGTVTANISRYSNLQSAFVKSPLFDNAIFSISKATNADGTVEYTGRIINEKYFDGYELKKKDDGTYFLNKIETAQRLHLCGQ